MFKKKKYSKKRKNGISPIFYIFAFFIIFIFLFIYKIYASSYINNLFKNSFQIKIEEKIKSKLIYAYLVLFNQYYLQILIPLLLVYNYCNVFKTFTLLISLIFPLIVSQIINLLLVDNIKDEKKVNDELLFAMGYPLFLWHLIFNSENNTEKAYSSTRSVDTVQKSQKQSIFWLLFVIIFIILEYLFNYILFNDISKIIFDAIIGLTLYFMFFNVLELDTNSPRQFRKIIDFRLIHYFLIFLFFNLFFLIFCIHIINNNEEKINIIKKIIFKYSLTSIIIGIILGSKYEYIYYFEKKLNLWSQYNFESDYEISDEEEEESLTSIISSNNKKQWNNTSFCLSLMRLLFIIVMTYVCLYSFLFINFKLFILELIIKYIFPLNLFSFGLFFWYKLLLKYLKVTNIFLLTSFRESF